MFSQIRFSIEKWEAENMFSVYDLFNWSTIHKDNEWIIKHIEQVILLT